MCDSVTEANKVIIILMYIGIYLGIANIFIFISSCNSEISKISNDLNYLIYKISLSALMTKVCCSRDSNRESFMNVLLFSPGMQDRGGCQTLVKYL